MITFVYCVYVYYDIFLFIDSFGNMNPIKHAVKYYYAVSKANLKLLKICEFMPHFVLQIIWICIKLY